MKNILNLLSAKTTKWSNTLKQFVGKLPTNSLSVFNHFVGLALIGVIIMLRFTYDVYFCILLCYALNENSVLSEEGAFYHIFLNSQCMVKCFHTNMN